MLSDRSLQIPNDLSARKRRQRARRQAYIKEYEVSYPRNGLTPDSNYVVRSSAKDGRHIVNRVYVDESLDVIESCNCYEYRTYGLPCQHMNKVKQYSCQNQQFNYYSDSTGSEEETRSEEEGVGSEESDEENVESEEELEEFEEEKQEVEIENEFPHDEWGALFYPPKKDGVQVSIGSWEVRLKEDEDGEYSTVYVKEFNGKNSIDHCSCKDFSTSSCPCSHMYSLSKVLENSRIHYSEEYYEKRRRRAEAFRHMFANLIKITYPDKDGKKIKE